MFTIAKGLNKTDFSTGGTLSTKAGAGRFKLPIQLLSVTADISTPIIVDDGINHKYIKLKTNGYAIAGNGITAIENDNSSGVEVILEGASKISGGQITANAFVSGATVSGYNAGTGTTIPNYASSYGTAANLTYGYGSLKTVTSTTDTTNTRILTGVNEIGTWPVEIGGNVVIGMATGGGSSGWWGNEGSDGGNSGAFVLVKKKVPVGASVSYVISSAGSIGAYQGAFGGPRNDASHGHHAYGGFITTGNFVTAFTNNTSSATITFQRPHGLSVDETFTLSNSSVTDFNRTYVVTTVNSTTQIVAAPTGTELYTAPTFTGSTQQYGYNGNAGESNGTAPPGLIGDSVLTSFTKTSYSQIDSIEGSLAYVTLTPGNTYDFKWSLTISHVKTNFYHLAATPTTSVWSVTWPGQGYLIFRSGGYLDWTYNIAPGFGGVYNSEYATVLPGVVGTIPSGSGFDPHVYWSTKSGNPTGLTFTGWSNGSTSQTLSAVNNGSALPGTALSYTTNTGGTGSAVYSFNQVSISGTVSETTELYIWSTFARRTDSYATLVSTTPPAAGVSFDTSPPSATDTTDSGAPSSFGELVGTYDYDAETGPAILTSDDITDMYIKIRGGGGGRWVLANHSTAVGEILNGDGTATAANLNVDEVVGFEGGALGGLSGQASGSGSPLRRYDAGASEYPHVSGPKGNAWVPTDYGWGSGGGDQQADGPNNSGAPGAIWIWHDVTQTKNYDDFPFDIIPSFGGSGATVDAKGEPTSGFDLTSFTGEFTRTG